MIFLKLVRYSKNKWEKDIEEKMEGQSMKMSFKMNE